MESLWVPLFSLGLVSGLSETKKQIELTYPLIRLLTLYLMCILLIIMIININVTWQFRNLVASLV